MEGGRDLGTDRRPAPTRNDQPRDPRAQHLRSLPPQRRPDNQRRGPVRRDQSWRQSQPRRQLRRAWPSRRFHPAERRRRGALHRIRRSEEHTSELQSLMRISYAVFCLKKKKNNKKNNKQCSNRNKTNKD